MIIVVRSRTNCSSTLWISCSLSRSIWLVASSRIRIAGSRRIARANAIRCRWPPESRSAAGPDHGVVPVFQLLLDESMGVGLLARLDDFVAGGMRRAVADVVEDGVVEQQRLLRDNADLAAQVAQPHCRAGRTPSISTPPVTGSIEPRDAG